MASHAPFRYSAAQKGLHWGMAVLIITRVIVGLTMTRLGEGKVTGILYELHKSVGLVVLALAIVRIGVRVARGVPPLEPGIPRLGTGSRSAPLIMRSTLSWCWCRSQAGSRLVLLRPREPVLDRAADPAGSERGGVLERGVLDRLRACLHPHRRDPGPCRRCAAAPFLPSGCHHEDLSSHEFIRGRPRDRLQIRDRSDRQRVRSEEHLRSRALSGAAAVVAAGAGVGA